MKRRRGLLVGGAVTAALLALAWVEGHRDPSATPTIRLKSVSSVAVAGTPAAEHSPETIVTASAPLRTPTSAHALPDWNEPLEESVPILLAAAESGDTIAQMDLSARLSLCTEHALRAADASDESDRETIEDDKTDARFDERLRAVRAANTQSRINQHADAKRACNQLPADVRAHWLDWVDRAAQSGNTAAMLEYAQMSVAEYDSIGAIVDDVDTAIERRDKARAYLLQALNLGDQRALPELAYGYFERTDTFPRVFGVDLVQSYAYAHAGTLAGVSTHGDLDWVMSESAKSLDARQLAEAQALGHRIYQGCCDKH